MCQWTSDVFLVHNSVILLPPLCFLTNTQSQKITSFEMYLGLLLKKRAKQWWRKFLLLAMWSVALFILSALLRYSLDRRAWRHLMEACVQQRQAGKLWRLPCSPDTTGWENLTLLFTVAFSLPSVHSALYATLSPLSLPPVSLSLPTPCFNVWPCMRQHDFFF